MKVCIVGANGFLGSNIALLCQKKNYDVLAVFNKRKENIPSGCKTMTYKDLIKSNLQFDIIFLTVGNFELTHKEFIDTNVNITQTISNKYKKAKIVFISSVAVYGFQKSTITLTSSFNNPSVYGMSKLAGEFIVTNHPKYSIVRLTYLYGRGMNKNSFLPRIIQDAFNKKIITLYGRGMRRQDYLHVQDAANLCILAAENSTNDVYLGATGKSLSNLKLATEVRALIPDCKIVKANIIDKAQPYTFNVKTTKEKLNWNPVYPLKKGLKEMILS